MNGYIRKSFRTKRMLEKYWDGTITGYLFKDIGESVNKCKTKKAPVQAYLTDEIARIEREIRSEARGWLMSLTEKAKQQDLEIKTKYVYITKDLDELNSRPQEGYTYTLVAEISRYNETDESRTVSVSTDLLYVRLGRTAYRGVKNEYAKDELEFTISDVLKTGVEVYCKNT